MMTLLHRARTRRPDDERGASLVEFALILPVFILLLFALIDFGLVFGGFITLRAQVGAAARNISVDQIATGCTSSSDAFYCTAESAIGNSLPGISGAPTVAIAFAGSPTVGSAVAVCAQGTIQSSTGLLSPILNGKTITVKSEVRLEQAPTETTDYNPAGIPCTA